MSDLLRTKLSDLRRRTAWVESSEGLAPIIILTPIALTAIMLLDYWLELPWIVRAIFLALLAAGAAFLLVRDVLVPFLRRPDEDELALRVERHTPTLASRLIATIQLTRAQAAGALAGGASVSLVSALIAETERLTEPMDFSQVARLDRLKKRSGIAGGVLVVWLVGMVIAGGSGVALLERVFLLPVDVPRRTRVELQTPTPLLVGKGDSVVLKARAIGVVPADGAAQLQYASDTPPESVRLDPVADTIGEFSATIQSVSQSFHYQIRLNDGHSADARVIVKTRPTITSLQITQQFPAYAQLPPKHRPPDDLQLLAGSSLSLSLTASSQLRSGEPAALSQLVVHCKSGDVRHPLTPSGADGKTAKSDAFAVPADATGLSIVLIDSDGLAGDEPVIYPITILPDQPPTVSVTSPTGKEQLSTAAAKLLVGIDARDDLALGHVRLCYRVAAPGEDATADDQDAKPSGIIEFRLPPRAQTLQGTFPIVLTQLRPRPVEGGSVEWWLEAEDLNNLTGPGKAASEHYHTKIVSAAALRADLFQQLSDNMGELQRTAETQKKDNADLGVLIQQQTPKP